MTSLHQRISFAPDVVLQVIGEDALLLKLHQEVVFSLNATGARIAQLIGTSPNVGAIVDALAGEYGVDVTVIAPDVLALIDEFAERRLITFGDEAPTS